MKNVERGFRLLYLVIIFSLLLLMLLLRLFIQKVIPIVLIITFIVGAAYFIFSQSQTVMVKDLYDDLYDPGNAITQVEVRVNEPDHNVNTTLKNVMIEDKEVMNEILDDLSDVEVKLNQDSDIRKYTLQFGVEKPTQIGSNFDYVTIYVDQEYVGDNLVLTETNHLETIKRLAKDESLSWTTRGGD